MGVTDTMRAALLLLPLPAGVHSRGLKFGPIAEANHAAESTLGCDPDYGWSDGAEGTGKCYMLIKNFDYSTCYSDGGVGGYGMSWFDAMECCYYNGLEDCIAIDSPKNYQWMDLNCTDPLHGAVTHFAVCERIPA